MKSIFLPTYWFWIVSKIVIATLLLISSISILGSERLKIDELIANVLGLTEAILLVFTLFYDFSSGSDGRVLKIISGALLILFGIGLFLILLNISEGSQGDFYLLGFPFAIWLILVGFFDLSRVRKPSSNKDRTTINGM